MRLEQSRLLMSSSFDESDACGQNLEGSNGCLQNLESNGCLQNLDEKSYYFLQKFMLYETRSNFYMIGRDKKREHWRVLKIDRLDPSELIICEDPTIYTENECDDLKKRIDEGNKSTGGLKFVTKCYGIVGFIKFLEPYYMILITKRRQIGDICGHAVYRIAKSQMILVPYPTERTNLAYCKDEQSRYKKLLSTVDLTKDFFFSYTYHVTRSLQKNLSTNKTQNVLYETMFVWNAYLTRGIRQCLKNTYWTVALSYGFFKQVKPSISGKHFILTLIARRSRHYAGTRYLKRGVNDKGRVANDVETEQIVFEDASEEHPQQICSVVQHRGSIPLYWSQETSCLNLKPDIILQDKDPTYQATQLHFENLVKRYGNPIIVLNLIKGHEKKPRETILCREFTNAVEQINRNLSEENQLQFIHWDLNNFFKSDSDVLHLLAKIATDALDRTGFFYSWITSDMRIEKNQTKDNYIKDDALEMCSEMVCDQPKEKFLQRKTLYQRGVLRTNCIDCLDRTNAAQYAFGLVALVRQLHSLGLINIPEIDPHSQLALDLMGLYETMGDTLAIQYGGSAAHNKVFAKRRGRWTATTNSKEFIRSLQRYYSNVYMDGEKQDAINVFLGHFQPQQGKPALWELDSDQYCNTGRRIDSFINNNIRSFKRSLSDGNILQQSIGSESTTSGATEKPLKSKMPLIERCLEEEYRACVHDCTPNDQRMKDTNSYSRFKPLACCRQLFENCNENQSLPSERFAEVEQGMGDGLTKLNLNDMEWPSSSGNSCDEDANERSLVTRGSKANSMEIDVLNAMENTQLNNDYDQGSENDKTEQTSVASGYDKETVDTASASTASASTSEIRQSEYGSLGENQVGELPRGFSSSFAHWVVHGQTLCH